MSNYDLTQLGLAFAARAADWAALGMTCSEPSEPTKTSKPATHVVFEGPAYLGDFVLWVSGEADGGVTRLSDGRRMEKVYALRTRADLDAAVSELLAFVRSDRVPDGGFLWGQ